MVNRKSYKIIISIAGMFFLTSCSKEKQLESNSSFRFENLTDSYDSNTATFSRRYADDTIRIKVLLNQEEKKQILLQFSQNNFQNFPSEIDCSSWGRNPKIYDELILNNHAVKYIHNVDQGLFCLKGKKFNHISTLIYEILMHKPEVKKLEMSDISYE